jgi:uncharacterized membrane protein
MVAAALWGALLFLAKRVPLDGHEHGDLGQFLGRMHPLLVHGPAALLLLVPAMELAALGGKRPHLGAAAGWILVVAAVSAYAAAFDGWLLAWSEGLRGRDVSQHLWAGVWLPPVCAAAVWLRGGPGRAMRRAYAASLVVSVGVLVWAADAGGAVTHGDGYLTAKMPERIRSWIGLPKLAPQPGAEPVASADGAKAPSGGPGSTDPSNPLYYGVHIAPLFTRSCVSCHRAEKHKGGLRMDSYALLMKGGEDGPSVVPGSPEKSDLLRRVRLPSTDDDFMPSDNEKSLTPEEIEMIEHWIASGAKGR